MTQTHIGEDLPSGRNGQRLMAAWPLIAAGVDIAIISKRLGHSKIDLTSDTYGSSHR